MLLPDSEDDELKMEGLRAEKEIKTPERTLLDYGARLEKIRELYLK